MINDLDFFVYNLIMFLAAIHAVNLSVIARGIRSNEFVANAKLSSGRLKQRRNIAP